MTRSAAHRLRPRRRGHGEGTTASGTAWTGWASTRRHPAHRRSCPHRCDRCCRARRCGSPRPASSCGTGHACAPAGPAFHRRPHQGRHRRHRGRRWPVNHHRHRVRDARHPAGQRAGHAARHPAGGDDQAHDAGHHQARHRRRHGRHGPRCGDATASAGTAGDARRRPACLGPAVPCRGTGRRSGARRTPAATPALSTPRAGRRRGSRRSPTASRRPATTTPARR